MYRAMGNNVSVSWSSDSGGDWSSSLSKGGTAMPPGCSMQQLQNWLKTLRSRAGLTATMPLSATGILDANTIAAFEWFRATYQVPKTATLAEVCYYLASLQSGAGQRPSTWPALITWRGVVKQPTADTSGGRIIMPGWNTRPDGSVVQEGTAAPSAGMSDTMKYALIGGAALLVVGGLYMVGRRKR